MISNKYMLTRPYTFEIKKNETKIGEEDLLIKPTYLSICAADLRYYQGMRDEKVLKEKLPMVLIHEGIGEIILDPKKNYKTGTKVVMIPNQPMKKELNYKENYDRTSKFRSSNMDGFLQEYIAINRNRIIDISDIDELSSTMLELLSVVYNAIDDCNYKIGDDTVIGVWGNGNLGFLLILVLRDLYPNSKIYLYGKNDDKNLIFTGQNRVFNIKDNEIYNYPIDIAFDCVGGNGSESAINQAIDIINPQGYIGLLGVSEVAPKINTRMVLEKGLTLQGSSRSSYDDFYKAVQFLKKSTNNQKNVKRLITEVIEINSIEDLKHSFDKSIVNNFKTVLKFNL